MILRDLLCRTKRRCSQSMELFSGVLRLRRTGMRNLEIVEIKDHWMWGTAAVPISPTAADANPVFDCSTPAMDVSTLEQQPKDRGPNSPSRELIFIATGATNYQQLFDDLWSHQDSNRRMDVVLLSPSNNGLSQITETLAQYQTAKLDAIHFFTHGSDRAIKQGITWLDSTSLHANREQITSWGKALNPGADLLFYGFDLAGDSQGHALLNQLIDLTGADIAASIDDSGSTLLGSHWELEYQLADTEMFSIEITAPLVSEADTSDVCSAFPMLTDSVVFCGTTDTHFGLSSYSVTAWIGANVGTVNWIPQAFENAQKTQRSPSSRARAIEKIPVASAGPTPARLPPPRAVPPRPPARQGSSHLVMSAMKSMSSDTIQDLITSIFQNTEMWNQLNTLLGRFSPPGQMPVHLSRRGKRPAKRGRRAQLMCE